MTKAYLVSTKEFSMRPLLRFTYILVFSIFCLGTYAQGLVGIYFTKDPTGETSYPMILGLVDGSPAEAAGLKIGQRIKSVDGKSADMDANPQQTVLGWIRGAEGSSLNLELTAPNDILKIENIQFSRGAAPTAANRLTNVAQVSQYFPMRLWSCFDAIEKRESHLMTDLIETTKTYNDKELKRWRVKKVFMNEIQEGTFESYVDEDALIKKEVYHDQLTFVLLERVENHFLAKKYYEDTKIALMKALKTEGNFTEGEETLTAGSPSTFNFGGFSGGDKGDQKEEWESWENRSFLTLAGWGITERGLAAKHIYLRLIGDGTTWKVEIEITMKATL